mmetsp:Transcript_12638/g.34752  ORF Transcript_12638/g.34752 Transcript_12638/m.34752 type:complete len:211 (-) Transcript_12638:54-686(-)
MWSTAPSNAGSTGGFGSSVAKADAASDGEHDSRSVPASRIMPRAVALEIAARTGAMFALSTSRGAPRAASGARLPRSAAGTSPSWPPSMKTTSQAFAWSTRGRVARESPSVSRSRPGYFLERYAKAAAADGCAPRSNASTAVRGSAASQLSAEWPALKPTSQTRTSCDVSAAARATARMCATARGHMAECPSAGGAPTDRRCASRATTSS